LEAVVEDQSNLEQVVPPHIQALRITVKQPLAQHSVMEALKLQEELEDIQVVTLVHRVQSYWVEQVMDMQVVAVVVILEVVAL
jgi:hypothetical protein